MLSSSIKSHCRAKSILLANLFLLLSGMPIFADDQPNPPAQPAADAPAEAVEELKKQDKPATDPPAADSKDAEKPKAAEADASQDSAPAEEKPPQEKVAEDKPVEKKAEKSLQQTLQEQLLGAAQEQIQNPVESILERMRNVQERLSKTATDKETRQEQTQIVQEIDKLIEALKNQKPPPPQSSSSNPNSPPPPPKGGSPDENQQAQGTPQPRPKNSQSQKENKPAGEKGKEQGQKQKQQQGQTESVADKAKESNGSSSKRPRSPEEEAARQRLAKDVWGHLPPALRQELLNIFSEKYIPKYDEQVRRYYEALAEENGGSK
jgi:hypothetical protein